MKIAIAGAFGFIGQHVIQKLLDNTNHEVVALSRNARQADDPRIQCVSADLYSLKEATEGLKGCDVAIYLVHSMAPNSRLAQGNFRDFDFILADNFARAAASNSVKQIIFVGGVIPDTAELSIHLQSRLEVEDVLRSYKIPVTAIRCGLVIGSKGSSFNIIVRLTERLPWMILPQWMRTLSNPIYVGDLAEVVLKAIEFSSGGNLVVDAGMDAPVSYKDIVISTASAMGKNPLLIDVPYVSPKLSKLWVRLVSGAPKALVYPLIDSVRHEMITDPKRGIPKEWMLNVRGLTSAVQSSFEAALAFEMPRLLSSTRQLSEVRSVQRMPLPTGRTAEFVAKKYVNWLPIFLRPFLKVHQKHDRKYEYRLRLFSMLLLSLVKDKNISSEHRQLFRVGEGLLVGPGANGRFEFRESPDRKFLIIALHNYRPALPWPIYRWTQAVVHKIVMRRFGCYLMRTYV